MNSGLESIVKTDLVTRQCNKTGNVRIKVTMRHAQVTIVTVEKQ